MKHIRYIGGDINVNDATAPSLSAEGRKKN